MHDERTNLYRAIAQNLQWIQGLTGIQYDIKYTRVHRTEDANGYHYPFCVVTNSVRPNRIKHPMALVVERVHTTMEGMLFDVPTWDEFEDDGFVDIEIPDMLTLLLEADNGGSSVISVQTKFHTFDGEENSLTRQFIYKNNMLFQVR